MIKQKKDRHERRKKKEKEGMKEVERKNQEI